MSFNNILYAGGDFLNSGPNQLKRIARWNGTNWLPLGLGIDDGSVYAFCIYQGSLAIGGTFTSVGGSFVNRIASWNGAGWATIGSGFNNGVYALFPSATYLYAGGNFDFADFLPASKAAMYNGTSWSALGSGLSGNNSIGKTITGFLGRIVYGGNFTNAGGNTVSNLALWGTPLGIKPIGGEVPGSYILEQNYPNPFNPVTKIRFGIPSRSGSEMTNVKIAVFNVLGKEIMELVNQYLEPGNYEIEFDGGNLSSGTYFYKLVTGDFTSAKKMIIMK
jgi:hypothetical protein